jgi:hypothetical protein
VIVLLHTRGYGVPVVGGDGARVEQRIELNDSIANVTVVGCSRSAKAVNLYLFPITDGREGVYGVLVYIFE